MITNIILFICGFAAHIFRDYDRYRAELTFKDYLKFNLYDITNTTLLSFSLFIIYSASMPGINAVNSFIAGYAGESALRFILKRFQDAEEEK
ncbi:MAG: hypothetical protein ACK518_00130 [bacterium]|jgi:hypothetical protein